jgi:hypothetical protein
MLKVLGTDMHNTVQPRTGYALAIISGYDGSLLGFRHF